MLAPVLTQEGKGVGDLFPCNPLSHPQIGGAE